MAQGDTIPMCSLYKPDSYIHIKYLTISSATDTGHITK